MDKGNERHQSSLFTLRVWEEETNGGSTEWRGKVQHLETGEIRYFRDWTAVLSLLLRMMQEDTMQRDEAGAYGENI